MSAGSWVFPFFGLSTTSAGTLIQLYALLASVPLLVQASQPVHKPKLASVLRVNGNACHHTSGRGGTKPYLARGWLNGVPSCTNALCLCAYDNKMKSHSRGSEIVQQV